MKEIEEEVEGFVEEDECKFLEKLAAETCAEGDIVEIGSWKGKSTIYLANGSEKGLGKFVWAVEPHCLQREHIKHGEDNTYPTFINNLVRFGVQDKVIPLVGLSYVVVKNFNKPICLLFIDGNHNYGPTKKDFLDWSPKVSVGGVLAFHDVCDNWDGPKEVIKEFVETSKEWVLIDKVGSLAAFKRIKVR